jgi:uncharacterized damage-inducible protein DinB
MENFNQQAEYSQWATGQWIDFVYSNPIHDPYLYRLVNHIVKGERAWLERIMSKDWTRDLWNVETKDDLLQLMDANKQMMIQFFERALEGRINVERLNGQIYDPKVADILQHIFYHGENHRGQLASLAARRG